jgi:hypothetical protein
MTGQSLAGLMRSTNSIIMARVEWDKIGELDKENPNEMVSENSIEEKEKGKKRAVISEGDNKDVRPIWYASLMMKPQITCFLLKKSDRNRPFKLTHKRSLDDIRKNIPKNDNHNIDRFGLSLSWFCCTYCTCR